VDIRAGEQAVFSVLKFLERRSITKGDLDDRCVAIMATLWSSKTIFRRRGVKIDPLRLSLCGRLSMSVIFDTLWWWRAEFEATPNPYTDSESNADATATVPEETVYPPQQAGMDTNMESYGYQDMPYMDPSFMSDWNWMAGLQSEVLLDPLAAMADGTVGPGFFTANIAPS